MLLASPFDFVPKVEHRRLDAVGEPLGCLALARPAMLRARGPNEHDAGDQRRDDHHHHVLGRRQIERVSADHHRRPMRQVHHAKSGAVEPRHVDLVAIADVRQDDVDLLGLFAHGVVADRTHRVGGGGGAFDRPLLGQRAVRNERHREQHRHEQQ